MRRLHVFSAALLCVLLAGAPGAATLDRAEFRFEQQHYHFEYSAHLAADVDAVRRVMTDYDRLSRLNDDVIVSRVLARFGERSVKRQVLMKHCVLVFCFDIDLVEQIDVQPDGEIVAVVVPGEGSFRSGRTTMRIEADPAGGTRVTSATEQQPDFFVPPLLGPMIMKRSFVAEITETTRRVEALANAGADD